jgi:hypothetical protein
MVWPPLTMPAPRPSIWEWRTTDSCAAIWNATPSSLRHVDPLIRELTEYCDLINLKTKENPNESD